MADIQTNVPLTVSPLITGDAESFRAEYDWPGGVPAPVIRVQTSPTYSTSVDVATLAATGAIQSFQFQSTELQPYVIMPLSIGVAFDRGTHTTTEQDAFWVDAVSLMYPGPNYASMRRAELYTGIQMEPEFLDSRVRIAKFPRPGDGFFFIQGEDFASGPAIAAEVDTFAAATGVDAFPYFLGIGWPARVGSIGAIRLPALAH